MESPTTTIITPTYNRPALFAECAQAVLAQSYQDWVWWVVFNPSWEKMLSESLGEYNWNGFMKDDRVLPLICPINRADRMESHIPARIVNWLYPKVQTQYIYFLADDDLIDPGGLEVLVRSARAGYDWTHYDAVYGRCEVVDQQVDGSYRHGSWCYDWGDVGLGTGIEPKCRLDGGQVLHTKALWDRATADGWALTDAKEDAAANDGTLLNRLAQFARFHYVSTNIVTHRRHTNATFHKPQLSTDLL